MTTLYFTRRSAVVSREGCHHLVKQYPIASSQGAYTMSIQDISSVVVVGEPSITFPALSALIGRQVPITFLTSHGKWRGILDTCSIQTAERRQKQYLLADNLCAIDMCAEGEESSPTIQSHPSKSHLKTR